MLVATPKLIAVMVKDSVSFKYYKISESFLSTFSSRWLVDNKLGDMHGCNSFV